MSEQLARWQFAQAYARLCRERDLYQGGHATRAGYELGLETRWIAYRGLARRARTGSRSFRSTNGQRCAQLAADGRIRGRRTVQRVHRDLEAMGVARISHIRRSGAARRPGELDCLSIVFLGRSRVTPGYAEPRQGGPLQGPPACLGATATAKALIPPPSAADDEPPDEPGERPSTETERIAARVRFLQLRLGYPFGNVDAIRSELASLSGQDLPRIASTTSRGLRCST